MIIYENYPNKQHPESGLCVAIERDGVRVVQVDYADCIGDWLVLSALFTWDAYHSRDRSYAGDDGSGRMRDRLVAAAISLIAYHGGEEHVFRTKSRAEDFAYEYILA